MNYIDLKLQDVESGESFTLKLSPTDAIKARNDMAFATSLLNYARQNASGTRNGTPDILTLPISTSDTSHTSNSEKPDVEDNTTQDEESNTIQHVQYNTQDVDNFRWPHEAILLLLEEYRKREQDMYSGKISHKKAWEQIAQVLNRKGYTVTGRQCTTRVNTMKRTYKTVKDHNKKSGNNKRSWKYLDVMESLLGEKPYMTPLATISSTGAETKQSSPSASSSSSAISDDLFDTCTKTDNVPRKRKLTNTVADALLESRKIAEESREKRLKIKMEAKEKLMEKLDKILKKF